MDIKCMIRQNIAQRTWMCSCTFCAAWTVGLWCCCW